MSQWTGAECAWNDAEYSGSKGTAHAKRKHSEEDVEITDMEEDGGYTPLTSPDGRDSLNGSMKRSLTQSQHVRNLSEAKLETSLLGPVGLGWLLPAVEAAGAVNIGYSFTLHEGSDRFMYQTTFKVNPIAILRQQQPLVVEISFVSESTPSRYGLARLMPPEIQDWEEAIEELQLFEDPTVQKARCASEIISIEVSMSKPDERGKPCEQAWSFGRLLRTPKFEIMICQALESSAVLG